MSQLVNSLGNYYDTFKNVPNSYKFFMFMLWTYFISHKAVWVYYGT